MASGKGKEVAGENSSGKRKFEDSDKTGRRRKRKNRGVLQFFDDAAYEVDEDEGGIDSDFFDDFLEDEFKTQAQVINEPGKAHHLPFFPKEEELSGEELEEMLEERYRPGSSFVTYAEDVKMSRKLMEGIAVIPPSIEPTIWKVKCMVGRERHSAFCLMQKYVDLHSLGTKLQIISAFAIEHVKGFIYIEAEKQFDINEACRGLCTIYSSRVAAVPKNEVSHLLSVRSKSNEISVGTWARIKNGKYKGDLAQVVAVNDARKKATVKLIPRIDIQAMAEKFGGGLRSKKTATPAPRLISSTELEEFRPLIQYRRDRDTGQAFEVLDGNQLKEGYLYKKVSIDSLSFSGVTPSEDELLKFEPSKKEESDCQEWLTQLYGERKKKNIARNEKGGGGKGEGSSSSGMASSFEVHDLVLFGRKDFGVIVGTEKDDYFKILKEGSEGPAVVTVELHQLKNGSFDKKFTALDHQKKIISINDTVRVLEGPLQGRQGIVKQIYRGIIFLHDENEQENSGYSCCKSQICEKIKLFDGSCKGKGGELGSTGFEDFSSSPKSPLSPEKGWQARENSSNFNREGNDGMFSVGQSLRIRVGPLKGYLCRVLAIRRSDITVKLDSQQKILTVKCEHLAEVRGKSSAVSFGDDAGSGKPFDLLGTQDCSTDWMAGGGTSTEGDTWGAGAVSAERSAWPAFPSSGVSLQPESSSANPLNLVDNDANRDVGGSAWESKVTSNQNSSWGSAVSDEKAVSNSEQIGGWGKGEGSWTKAAASTGFGSVASDNWGSVKFSSGDQAGPSKVAGDNWNATKRNSSNDAAPCWGNKTEAGGNVSVVESKNQTGGWGSAGGNSAQSEGEAASGWMKAKTVGGGKTESWGNMTKNVRAEEDSTSAGGWGNAAGSSWNKQDGGSSWNKQTGGSSTSAPESRTGGWGNADGSSLNKQDGGSSWNKQSGGSSWGNQGGGSSWNKQTGGSSTSAPESQTGGWANAAGSSLNEQDGGSSWNKQGGGSSWGHQAGGSWNKQTGGSSTSAPKSQTREWGNAAGSSWNKQDGGSSWNKQTDGSSTSAPESQTGGWDNAAGSSLNKQDGGSSWNKQTDGSSTSAPESQTGGWDNAAGSSLNKQDGGSSWNKQTGGSSTSVPESPIGGWGNPSGSSLNKQDGGSSWKKQGGGSSWGNQAGGSSWNKQTGGSSWMKQTDMNKEDDSKERAGQIDSWGKPSGANSGFGGWSSNRMGNKDETDPKENWEGTKSFDGGRGFGGRRGRGGRGGRDQFGRGRSFGQGQSSGWSKEGQEYHGKAEKWSSSDGGGWGSSGGNKDQPEAESGGWKKSARVDGGQSGSWGNTEKDGGATGWGTKEGWNSSTGSKAGGSSSTGIPENQTGGWGNAGSSWGKSLDIPGQSTGKGSEDSWGKAAEKQSSKDGSVGSKATWNTSMAAAENQSGGWGNAGGSWSKKSDGSSWGKQAGGSSWTKQTDMSSEESKEGTDQKGSWGKTSGGDGGFGGWNKSGMGNSDTDQAEGWGRSKSFEGGYDSAGRRGDSGYQGGYGGRGGSDRGSFRGGSDRGGFRGRGRSSGWNEEGQDSGKNVSSWSGGQGGGWGRGRGFDGGEDDRSDSGGYGGRGGSDRGGFRGRGRSDRGGYRGRVGFDRGGFRGRGSERGGFGGHGGRRDQNSDWSSRNDSSEDKPSGWKKNDDGGGSWSQGGGGWSQSGGGGGWSQSGGSWSQSGGGGGNGQSWNSGWKPSKGAVESRAADDQAGAGGWKGSGSAKDAGGSDAGGGWNSQASSWNKSTGGSSGTWNQSNVAAAADGGQSSGWNQPKEPRGASEDGGAADPWGKASTSSWGKGKDGGSKGGW